VGVVADILITLAGLCGIIVLADEVFADPAHGFLLLRLTIGFTMLLGIASAALFLFVLDQQTFGLVAMGLVGALAWVGTNLLLQRLEAFERKSVKKQKKALKRRDEAWKTGLLWLAALSAFLGGLLSL